MMNNITYKLFPLLLLAANILGGNDNKYRFDI